MSTVTGVAKCRSCGAEIVWVITESGKRMPLDAEASDDGTFVVRAKYDEERRAAVLHAIYAPEGGAGRRHQSHFATCPHADQWRQKR